MQTKRLCTLVFAAFLLLTFPAARAQEDAVSPSQAQSIIQAQQGQLRALLIGVDEFVSKPDSTPSSLNNVAAMRDLFAYSAQPPAALVVPDKPLTTVAQLTDLIQSTFGAAQLAM